MWSSFTRENMSELKFDFVLGGVTQFGIFMWLMLIPWVEVSL